MIVLDHGKVELINFMGGDLAVVASARVSNGELYESASKGEDADRKLINYLAKHRHGTPFEHSYFTFYAKTPLFVAREWLRHRIGSFNEISGRYVEMKEEFYIPERYRIAGASNKQGSRTPEPEDLDIDINDWEWVNRRDIELITAKCYETYQMLLSRGVAKEMARMVLPLNMYTEFYWTVNSRSLMNFLKLRLGDDAQLEIRAYASVISKIFEEKMPMTYDAWAQNGYVAP